MEIRNPKVLGSTDHAALQGGHSWKSPHDVWRRCIGIEEDKPVGEYLKVGLLMEPSHKLMLEEVLKEGGYEVVLKRAKTLHYEVDGVQMRITGDYFAVPSTKHHKALFGAELKEAHGQKRSDWGAPMSDDIPFMYKLQCILQCYRYDWPFVILSARFSNFTMPVPFLIHAEHETAKQVEEESAAWYKKYVEGNVLPPVDETSACRKTLLEREEWLASRRPLTEEESKVAWDLTMLELELARKTKQKKRLQNYLIKSAAETVVNGRSGYEELTYQEITDDKVKDKKFCQFKADKNGKMSAKFYPKGFQL